jgi:hypothetical protein
VEVIVLPVAVPKSRKQLEQIEANKNKQLTELLTVGVWDENNLQPVAESHHLKVPPAPKIISTVAMISNTLMTIAFYIGIFRAKWLGVVSKNILSFGTLLIISFLY